MRPGAKMEQEGLLSNHLVQGGGKRELLCFTGANCLDEYLKLLRHVCVVAIWKA